jgi:predicted metal-dependent phosphoesterase TrpH/glycosyltransferase involved in cell wall biosynthesis
LDGSGSDWPLAIAQVTPYPWGARREVNEYVEHVSHGLARRGHRVLVLAASGSRAQVREARRVIKSAARDPDSVFDPGGIRVLAPMQTLVTPARRGGRVSLPLDASRAIDRLLDAAPLDFVHVHEPFAPSASAAALRHSRALNVGSFHSPTERVLSTQVARRFIELFFGRLDARLATFDVTRGLISSFFPGDYTVVRPGVDLERFVPGDRGDGPLEIAFVLEEERASLRLFLRALRRLPLDREWRATIWTPAGVDLPARVAGVLRERVRITGSRTEPLEALLARADVFCAASAGTAPRTTTVMKAIATGAVPVAARIPVYEEALRDGTEGLLFEPGDAVVLGAQLARLAANRELLLDLRRRCLDRRPEIGWDRVVDEVERTYRRVLARRHRAPADRPAIARRLSARRFIHCDLHMHTDHSPDCATPVDVLLETAKRRGLGAIAITDHNEISGALEARERARGIKVIVSEEVKTADEGEVIGLFIEDKIPRGMTMKETIDAIHSQGGLAYVPHPFDRLHSVPDYEHLLRLVGDLDVLEVFNARVAVRGFNEEAQRFADKYRLVAGAGSDSHVPQGLGTVKIRMRDFEGPREFLESLRDADILHKRKSLIYLQGLKFLKTTAARRQGGGRVDGGTGQGGGRVDGGTAMRGATRRPASRR